MSINIDEASNYKNCRKKQYEIYVCMPPKNTVVINKLEQADVISQLRGKTFFTAQECEELNSKNPQLLQTLQQLLSQGRAYLVTNERPFVLAGTVGEMWTITADALAKKYVFVKEGKPVPINTATLRTKLRDDCLDWTLIRTSQESTQGQSMACFVPLEQKGQIQTSGGAVLSLNLPGINHGKGDFIVCSKLPNGQPNLASRWVVNGEIFAATYNNQGWTDCISPSSTNSTISIDSLPKLVSSGSSRRGMDIDSVYNCLDKFYRFDFSTLFSRLMLLDKPLHEYTTKSVFYNEITKKSTDFKTKLNNGLNNKLKLCSVMPLKTNKVMDAIVGVDWNDQEKLKSVIKVCELFGNILLEYGLVLELLTSNEKTKAKEVLFNYIENYKILGRRIEANYPYLDYIPTVNTVTSDGIAIRFKPIYSFDFATIVIEFLKNGKIVVRPVKEDEEGENSPKVSKHISATGMTCRDTDFFTDCTRIIKKSLLSAGSSFEMTIKSVSNKETVYRRQKYFFNNALYRSFSCMNGEPNQEDLAQSVNDVTEPTGKYRFRFYLDTIKKVSTEDLSIEENSNLKDSCTMFFDIDWFNSISVKMKRDNETFSKKYDITVGQTLDVIAIKIFVDICRIYKLHPAKTLYSSKRTWTIIFEAVNLTFEELNINLSVSPVAANVEDTKVSVKFNISKDNKVIGTRTFIVEFNYKSFDYSKSTSISTKYILDMMKNNPDDNSFIISSMVVATHLSHLGQEGKAQNVHDVELSTGVQETIGSFVANLIVLYTTTKKYRVIM